MVGRDEQGWLPQSAECQSDLLRTLEQGNVPIDRCRIDEWRLHRSCHSPERCGEPLARCQAGSPRTIFLGLWRPPMLIKRLGPLVLEVSAIPFELLGVS